MSHRYSTNHAVVEKGTRRVPLWLRLLTTVTGRQPVARKYAMFGGCRVYQIVEMDSLASFAPLSLTRLQATLS